MGADQARARVRARETIEEIEQVRRRSRARASVMWFPLVLFGALQLGGTAMLSLDSGDAVGAYWTVAGPLGAIATGAYAAWWARRVGVEVAWAPYAVTGGLMVVFSIALGAIGGIAGWNTLAAAGPPLVVSAGLLVFARLERSRGLAAVALALAAVVGVLLVLRVEPDLKAIAGSLAYGLAFLWLGLVALARWRRAV
jgi:hypothetical protein